MAPLLRFAVQDLPQSIVWDEPVSDDLLERLCSVNPPTGLRTSDGNSEFIQQLRNWWKTHRQGRVTDSNAGFYLSDGSMLSPDALTSLRTALQSGLLEPTRFPTPLP